MGRGEGRVRGDRAMGWWADMTVRSRSTRTSISDAELICHFCPDPAPNSPYRALMSDIPGGRWVICSPGCKSKPAGTVVVMASNWRKK